MVSRLLFIFAQAGAVLEVARPRQTQPKAIRIAPPESPTTDSRGGAVAAWHAVPRRELPLRAPRLPEGAALEAARAQETRGRRVLPRESVLACRAAGRVLFQDYVPALGARLMWNAALYPILLTCTKSPIS